MLRGHRFRTPRSGRAAFAALLLSFAFVAPGLLAPGLAAATSVSKGAAGPELNAATWLLLDPRDGEELAGHKADKERSIASTTKLMTAFLALRKLPMSVKLKVPEYSPATAESIVGLSKGERLTVRDLLLAMMLPSANDAAETVADGLAGSEQAFVVEMNRAAADLGLDHTHYANPVGLDAKDNYSTASDLSTLALELLSDRRFRKIVGKREATLTSGAENRQIETTNTLMLSDPSVDGVKTGHTLGAGYVLVASAKRDGVPLLAAVLGAPSEADRDAETERLLDYGYSLYRSKAAIEKGRQLASASVRYEGEPLSLTATRGVDVSVRADQNVRVEVDAPKSVEGPIAIGARLGQATVTVDGKFVDRVSLVAARAIAKPTLVDKIGGPVVAALIVVVLIVILAAVAFVLRRRGGAKIEAERDPEERMTTHQERIRRRKGGDGE